MRHRAGGCGFVLGFIADAFRSVFMPASTEWINRRIPSARKKVNVEENILTLGIMEKLKSLGKDPDLAKHARDDADQFLSVLTSQLQAFVDNAIEVIDSTYITQTEMNAEAGRRADVAETQMERAVVALKRDGAAYLRERIGVCGSESSRELKHISEDMRERHAISVPEVHVEHPQRCSA